MMMMTFVQYLCQTYADVDEKVHNVVGDILYERFMVSLYKLLQFLLTLR